MIDLGVQQQQVSYHSKADWQHKRLDELGSVGRGRSRHRPRDDASLYGGQYPFVQTGDIKAAGLYLSTYTQTYNELGLAQSKLWSPGTLCITIAANIAETAILKIPACFPDSVVGFISNPEVADTRFVKYYIDTIKLRMQNISRGTTQDNLSLDKLLTFDILTPPLATQRKIAAILSAYDDLIENNTHRIAILESMAQMLYREWFVHFRFPGHATYKMIDSSLGPIPEGWELGRLDDALYLQRGFDLPLTSRRSGTVPVYAATGLNGFHDEAKVKGPGVVTGRSGSLGSVTYIHDDFWPLNTTLWVKEFRRATPVYGYYLLQSLDFAGYNSGAAVPTLNRNDVHSLVIILPPQCLIELFDQQVSIILASIKNLRKRSEVLCNTRDLLLSKIITGEVDVEGLAIQIPEGRPIC